MKIMGKGGAGGVGGGLVPFASLAGEEVAYLGTGGTYSRKCDTQVLLHN